MSTLLHEIAELRWASNPELRKFGYTVGGVLSVLGLWFVFRHKPYAWPVLGPGVGLLAAGFVFPRFLRWPYVAWMTAGLMLGTIVSTVLLVVLFLFVVTPIALIGRVCGKDFLSQRMDRSATSYWLPRDTQPKRREDYQRQF